MPPADPRSVGQRAGSLFLPRAGPCGPSGACSAVLRGLRGPSRGRFPQNNPQWHQFRFQPLPHFLTNCPAPNKTHLIYWLVWAQRGLSTLGICRSIRKSPIVAEMGPRGHAEEQEAIRDAWRLALRAGPPGPRVQGPRQGACFQEAVAGTPFTVQLVSHALCHSATHWGPSGNPLTRPGLAEVPSTSLLWVAPQPVSAGPLLEDPGRAGWS